MPGLCPRNGGSGSLREGLMLSFVGGTFLRYESSKESKCALDNNFLRHVTLLLPIKILYCIDENFHALKVKQIMPV